MSDVIINRVTDSVLVTLNLEDYFNREQPSVFDLKDFLFMNLILKEKDYREALKVYDFSVFKGKLVCVTCSVDAIIPMWAYMLAAVYLDPYAARVTFGTVEQLQERLLLEAIARIDVSEFADKRVVVKGCGDLHIGEAAYLEITALLRPVVKSLMYGEPCSTVPIYKQAKPV